MSNLKRKVANPLALAVLVLLYERPMHPYEMAATLRERRKEESIKLRYGSLYTVIELLVKAGFIAQKKTTREGNRPERTVYEINKAGEAEMRADHVLIRPETTRGGGADKNDVGLYGAVGGIEGATGDDCGDSFPQDQ